MPITRSAEKRMRSDRKRRLRNLQVVSELKTLTVRFQKLAQEGSAAAKETLSELLKRLDQAASHGVIHRGTASRKKSRLSRHLNKLKRPA